MKGSSEIKALRIPLGTPTLVFVRRHWPHSTMVLLQAKGQQLEIKATHLEQSVFCWMETGFGARLIVGPFSVPLEHAPRAALSSAHIQCLPQFPRAERRIRLPQGNTNWESPIAIEACVCLCASVSGIRPVSNKRLN